jgi:hypothetical protein
MNSPKYHSLETIMENAKKYGGNKTPEPELITVESERERLGLNFKTASQQPGIASVKTASSTGKS